jgi:hypothetical protein
MAWFFTIKILNAEKCALQAYTWLSKTQTALEHSVNAVN